MREIRKGLRGILINGSPRFCTIYDIERPDGTILRFCDVDFDVQFEGNTYKTAGGFDSTDTEKVSELETSDVTFTGILTSDDISFDDLRAGLYDGSKVTVRVIDWMYPSYGAFSKDVFWIEKTSFSKERWEAELSSRTRFLTNKVGIQLNRTCRHSLGQNDGSVGCFYDLAANEVTGTVTSVANRNEFTANFPSAEAAQYFRYGTLTWDDGNNVGLKAEIRDDNNTTTSRVIKLQLDMPFSIEIDDRFILGPGCDKLVATCNDKFNQFENFGGFPDLPGDDRQFNTPNSR